MGWLVKATAIYDEPFWRADGLSGEALNEAGPVTLTFDNCPPGGSPRRPGRLRRRTLTHAAFARLGKSERRRAVLGCFESLFGPRAQGRGALHRAGLGDASAGAAAARCDFATGGWTASGAALREPVGPVHWAGTETATRWSGYIDGAISSGERAAGEVRLACTLCMPVGVGSSAPSSRRQRNSLTRSSIPFSRRSPANDHS